MPSTGAGGLGGLTGGCDGVTGGRVAKRGLSHTSHRILLAAFTIVQLRHCHSDKDTLIYTHVKIHTHTSTVPLFCSRSTMTVLLSEEIKKCQPWVSDNGTVKEDGWLVVLGPVYVYCEGFSH